MNDVLKQRLVGALILVALGVVFWPIIFVEPGEGGRVAEARIPPRPAVVTNSIEPPDLAGLRPSKALQKTEVIEPEPPSQRPLANSVTQSSTEPATSTAEVNPQSSPTVKAAAKPPAPSETAPTKTRTEAPVKPVVDADGIPVAWILRVASVSSGSKADELRQQLLKMGHKAYRQKVKSGGKTLYRVYVGPKVERAQLEKIQSGIDAEFGVSTLITRYYP